VGDLNGDGRPDIITSEERYPGEKPNASLYWYEPPADPGNIEVSMAHSTLPSYPSTRTRAWRRRGTASVPDLGES
jgi:hypothetical protein